MRKKNIRECVPNQKDGQDARSNTFNTGEAKDSLSGKNMLKEHKTSGKQNAAGAKGGKNTNS